MAFQLTLRLIFFVIIYTVTGCGNDNNPPTTNSSATYTENFTASNGNNWPIEWQSISTSDVNADIQNNRGHLQTNSTGKVARVVSTTLNMVNFDAKITLRFGDHPNQGIGFYGRQNGGYLTATSPNGQGYGTFTEGNSQSEIGIWDEIDGVETLRAGDINPLGAGNILNNTNYCVRFRVEQINSTQTQLRTKIWLQSDPEPTAWNVELMSTTLQLQNLSGGFAVDIYNYSGTGSIYFDDIEISDLDS